MNLRIKQFIIATLTIGTITVILLSMTWLRSPEIIAKIVDTSDLKLPIELKSELNGWQLLKITKPIVFSGSEEIYSKFINSYFKNNCFTSLFTVWIVLLLGIFNFALSFFLYLTSKGYNEIKFFSIYTLYLGISTVTLPTLYDGSPYSTEPLYELITQFQGIGWKYANWFIVLIAVVNIAFIFISVTNSLKRLLTIK